MQNITKDSTVEQILASTPSSSEIFEAFGIDYCCGGKATLEAACGKRGLDTGLLLARLLAPNGKPAPTQEPAREEELSLTELANRIETGYHAKLWQEMERLDALTAKVALVHGSKDARLAEIRAEFKQLSVNVSEHMVQEERVLFPLIRRLDSAEPGPFSHLGSLAATIRKMSSDHEHAEAALQRIRELADDYAPPEYACFSYRSMLSGLKDLESVFHEHKQLEHGLLLPKALKLEEAKDASAISRIFESESNKH
jgi:regulator of cell morphogenesis and NO signaling